MDSGTLNVIYGNNPLEMTIQILSGLEIQDELDRNSLIGIKPNLVNPTPSKKGATTSPQIVEGIIKYFRDNGFNNIIIMEGSWVGARTEEAFRVCGYTDLANKYGVELVNLKDDKFKKKQIEGMEIKIAETALRVDYFINVPVLKAHCQTKFTCALKNLKGCIPDTEKRRFHTMGLHRPIAYLAKLLPVDLIIVDAIYGDLTFEEGGNPVQMDRIITGRDPVLVDSYGASLIGYAPHDIEYIEIAREIGIGSIDLDAAVVNEYNRGEKSKTEFSASRKVEKLASKVVARDACSACYGSLIHALQRLQDTGELKKIDDIYIGQDFRGKSFSETGIGNCTSGFSSSLSGCPPSARDIVEFLRGKYK